MPEWAPEVTVDEALARRLIGGQFPDVPLDALRLIGEGWDNTVWLADERWVFRFPRRTIAIPGVEREIAALPALAPRLPLPIPAPVFVGAPADGFPWPFFGAVHLVGEEPLGLSETARAGLARPLGEFLRALHRADVAAELPDDPFGRADMAFRVPQARERIAHLEDAGLWRAPAAVARVLDEAERLPKPRASVVVHGDLHVRHLLVSGGALSGVIDWGDLCRGDPSMDMSLLWNLIPAGARPDFLAAYGPVSHDQLVRARVLALFLCAVLALYAHTEGMHDLEREALAGLDRAAGN